MSARYAMREGVGVFGEKGTHIGSSIRVHAEKTVLNAAGDAGFVGKMDESTKRAAGGAEEIWLDAARRAGFHGVFRESMARFAEEYLLNPARGAAFRVGVFAGMPVVADPSVEPGTVEFRYVRQTFRCRLRADEAPVPGQFHVKLRQLLQDRWSALASELAHG